jgi:DNA-binding transcriptional LysR family regulator
MDFGQLRTFVEVAGQKSFSRAAQRLSLTQPAISAQIRSLEKEVGAKLFERHGGKINFTAAGRVFEPFAEHCLDCYGHILGTVAELYRSPRGSVSISANEATCLYVLPVVFAQFKRQCSQVGLSIIRADRRRTLDAVLNREVDFGIVTLPVNDHRLITNLIHEDELSFVMPAGHSLAARPIIEFDELAQHPLLLMKRGRQRELIDHLFHVRDLEPKIAVEVESSELLKQFVVAGLGTGFLPNSNICAETRNGTLKTANIKGFRMPRELALIHRKGKELTRAAQAFLEIATKQKEAAGSAQHLRPALE